MAGRTKELTDAQVEAEISRLKDSDFVKLSKRYLVVQNRRRKLLSDLRWHYKQGQALTREGVTIASLYEEGEDGYSV